MIDRYKGNEQMQNVRLTKSKSKEPHSPNKERESDSDRLKKQTPPNYKPKPKDDGGSSMAKKKDPKKPMSPAAKRLKRTASRPK
jgi:hypothetical protein